MSTTLETLRHALADNRDQIDNLATGPITLATMLERDLRIARRHALLARIDEEMSR